MDNCQQGMEGHNMDPVTLQDHPETVKHKEIFPNSLLPCSEAFLFIVVLCHIYLRLFFPLGFCFNLSVIVPY